MSRTQWIVVAMVMGCWEPAAAESLEPPPAVRGGAVEIRFDRSETAHASRDDLTGLCRADYPVEGCTRFPTETLECSCKLRNGEWMIDTSARIEAVMHVPKSAEYGRIVAHEQRHLADLEEQLRLHLASLTLLRYESESACRRMAEILSVSSHLTVVMNELRTASNAKFGCSRDAQ